MTITDLDRLDRLNQSIAALRALTGDNETNPMNIHLAALIDCYNEQPIPSEWDEPMGALIRELTKKGTQ